MSDNKSWFRKSDALVAAFAAPVLIMIIIFIQRGIFPFGDNSFLRTDMYHQYAPFFSEFRDKLVTGKSLLYSWNIGMGVNFSAIYAYYLASPMNWLIVLVPDAYVIEFMTYSIVFKIGLSGLAMTYYLNRHMKNKSFMSAFFGIFYALSGYMAAYSWNLMWLDCIVLFPLIVLGLEKLVEDKNGLMYAVMLGLCITSNYYISIMICIFLVFWFFMLLILSGKKGIGHTAGSAGLFAGYSLLAGALSAAVLLPALFALKSTASGNISFPKTVKSYFSVIDMLARHMMNVQTEQGLDHWPNIYCGSMVFPLIILYVLNRRISIKEKAVYGLFCLFMLSGFEFDMLNFIWHGFHYPNSLPARQGFIYIFLLLYMGFRTADESEGNTSREIGIATVLSMVFVLSLQKLCGDDAIAVESPYLTMLFIAVCGIVMCVYRKGSLGVNAAVFILLGAVAVESAVNTTCTSVTTVNRTAYIGDTLDARALADTTDGSDFFRFDKTNSKTKDEGAWLHIHTAPLFSSTARESMSRFLKKIGCESSVNAYSINGATPLVDALFDIRYSISPEESSDSRRMLKGSRGSTFMYRNPDTLPLGYMLPIDLEDNWRIDASDPVQVQNDLCTLLNLPDILTRIEGFYEGDTYTATVPEDGLYYIHSENLKTDTADVTVDGNKTTFNNLGRVYLIELGFLSKNTIIDFKPIDGTDTQAHVYRFDYDVLDGITQQLGASQLVIDNWNDTCICGNIDALQNGVLFLSIPYDKGWNITVDGEIRTARELFDTFIGIDLTEGSHKIQMTYSPEGLKEGMMLSIAAAVILLILLVIRLVRAVRAGAGRAESDGKATVMDTDTAECDGSKAEEITYPGKPDDAEGNPGNTEEIDGNDEGYSKERRYYTGGGTDSRSSGGNADNVSDRETGADRKVILGEFPDYLHITEEKRDL